MLKFYIQPNFKKHKCFICKDEAKLASKFYDGKGIERQLFYCKKCMFKGKNYDYPVNVYYSSEFNKQCEKCDKNSIACLNNNFFCLKHLTE